MDNPDGKIKIELESRNGMPYKISVEANGSKAVIMSLLTMLYRESPEIKEMFKESIIGSDLFEAKGNEKND
jgi:hypothetical protein